MKIKIMFLMFFLFLSNFIEIYPQAGQLDTAFGQGGIVSNIINPNRQNSFPRAVVIQNDEKIVVAGSAHDDFLAMRYNQDGNLDNSFGFNGIASANGGASETARSLAMQNDGKLIAAGFSNQNGKDSFGLVRFNTDGSVDRSFGSFGNVVTPIGEDAYSNSVLIQPDEKIVVVGTSEADNQSDYNFTLARYNSDGSLDSTFGINGIVTTSIGTTDSYPYSVQIQTDGKLVVVGKSVNGKKLMTLVRYQGNGSLDNSFGVSGIVTTPVENSDSEARSIAIQNNGKIIVAGDYSNGINNNDYLIARYNSDGTLDSTFGTNGITTTPIGDHNDEPNSVIIQNDGKILTAGRTYNVSEGDIVLVRYNSDGSLDDSFGNNGIKITAMEKSSEQAYAVAKLNNGKIIATGSIESDADGSNSITIRYNADGSLDNTFGANGIVITKVQFPIENITSVALQNINDNEKIITSSYTFNGNNYDFALSRFNPDGTPDNTFGMNGNVIVSINDSSNDYADALAIQNDGKIVVTGKTFSGNSHHLMTIRYNSDGSMDNTFGNEGVGILPMSVSVDFPNSISIQNDGKIVVSGYSFIGNNADFAAARYNQDGNLDNDFGTDGIIIIPIGNSHDFGFSSAIQEDGKIILAGSYRNGDKDNFSLVRCNVDGKLDSTFGTGGIVNEPIGTGSNRCYSIQLQNDGKIVAAGFYIDNHNSEVAVARYNSDGSLDSTFGTNGIVFTQTADSSSVGYSVKLQDDGKIVIGGSDKDRTYLTLRYNNDGSLDSTFGINGIKADKFSVGYNAIKSVAIQKDGNIIAAGFSGNEDETILVNTILRYTGDKKPATVKVDNSKGLPASFNLLENYPNPFNPSTNIIWEQPYSSHILLKVYDILGREVATLVNEEKPAGNYKITFDAKDLASGIYFYRLNAGNYTSVKKMILLR